VKNVQSSLQRLEKWVEDHDYKGYEPFDGLSSRLRPLTFGSLFADRLLLQLIRQSPLNLRPLLGVRPLDSTKGRGYMAAGYLTMFKLTGEQSYELRARKCLEWLIEHKSPRYQNFSWANYFDFASRGGRYTRDESIIVWTAIIGLAFLDGYELLHEEKYLKVATSVCDWIMALPRQKTDSGTCLSYLATSESYIHNSNMLGAAMLARTGKLARRPEYTTVAAAAMEYSCSRQLADGSWYYGEKSDYHWIDNFHTGYNLDSLKCYIESTGDETYRRNLTAGFRYFLENFFEADGLPKYYHNRAYPLDIQCAAQAIETLAKFRDSDDKALDTALRVAKWTIDNMQDKDGHFYYRRYPLMIARTAMLHWGQATMYKGLTTLVAQLTATRATAARAAR
jgi:rhamnogalacturonyl hydrolase YesR